MKNREWLESLSDEELCRYLKGCDICVNYRSRQRWDCPQEYKECDFGHFEWLQSEHEEAGE